MPRAKEGHRIVTVVMPEALAVRLERLAASLGRSLTAELVHAGERHVEQPPQPMAVPPLAAATAVPAVKAKPGPKPRKPKGDAE